MIRRGPLGAAALLGLALTTLSAESARIERGSLVLDGLPDIPSAFAERLNQYQQTRSASLEGWLADGSLLIATRFGETAQLHRVLRPGGARTQLTFFAEPVASASPDPKGKGFAFSKDRGGDEFYQLWWYALDTGDIRPLTEDRARNTGLRWARGGERFAYSTTRRNGRDTDIHVMDRATRLSRPVLEVEGSWSVLDWSTDDRLLLVQKFLSINQTELWIVPSQGGTPTRLHPSEQPIAFGNALFAADGRGVYYISDEGSDLRRLHFESLGTGKTRVVNTGARWDVEDFALSPSGLHLAYLLNADGYSELHVLNTKTGREIRLPPLARGVISDLEFSPRGDRLGFVLNGARSAGDVYALDLARATFERWTYSETGGLDATRFVEPELVRYPSFDGLSIPAYYYRAPTEGARPVLIQIHGGPEAQARPTFSPITEFQLRELGISVLVPNVRGSDGYGKRYLQLDNGLLREDSVRDIGALLDWIATRPELDATRVAVAGGSYGGYMSLASLAHFNARLRCGVDTVGISNFVTFLTNTQDYRRDLRRAEYGDERDPEMRAFLERISPTTNAARIQRPLFVLQGANDPRVPASEAEQIVQTVRGDGGEVWYLLAKDEGHGFRKKSNRDAATTSSAWFLRSCLGASAARSDAASPAAAPPSAAP